MTDIQKAIRDGIKGICYDIQNNCDSEECQRMAEAVKTLVEAYNITTRFDNLNRLPKFETGGLVEEKVRFID